MGCAGRKHADNEKIFERGWIGGEYKPAHSRQTIYSARGTINAFPPLLRSTHKAGILLTALSTNTPAQFAGLHEGDLILELDGQPVTRLQDFRRTIDHSQPGTMLAVRAFREGEILDCKIPVGRETFRRQGELVIALPLITQQMDLWPNPGISLVVLGYEPNPGHRVELGSVEARYQRSCDPKTYQAINEDWRAWLVIFQLSRHKIILSQERVEPRAASRLGGGPILQRRT